MLSQEKINSMTVNEKRSFHEIMNSYSNTCRNYMIEWDEYVFLINRKSTRSFNKNKENIFALLNTYSKLKTQHIKYYTIHYDDEEINEENRTVFDEMANQGLISIKTDKGIEGVNLLASFLIMIFSSKKFDEMVELINEHGLEKEDRFYTKPFFTSENENLSYPSERENYIGTIFTYDDIKILLKNFGKM